MLLMKNFLAGAAIPAYTPVKFTGNPGEVIAAVAAGDKVIGVTTDTVAASGDRVDVIIAGAAKVVAGAAFAQGDLLMANASSQAIVAAAAAGANVRTFGMAREAGSAANDVVEIFVVPGSFQG